MHVSLRLICVSFAALLMAACSAAQMRPSPEEGGILSVSQSSYQPGDVVMVRLVNASDESLTYNLCRASVEQQTARGWQTVDRSRDCATRNYRLAPTEVTLHELPLPDTIQPGTYRVSTSIDLKESGRRTLHTSEFTVAARRSTANQRLR
jgi:hypothetical protein